MNITTTIYTLECYHNGEAVDFQRGLKVKGGIGHHYYEEFDTIEDARDALKKIKEDFFMRDNGEYDHFRDEHGEEVADKALAEFVAIGTLDDDSNYYGIRSWETFSISTYEAAEILANSENAMFTDLCAALDRLEVKVDPVDYTDITDDEDPMAAAIDENYDRLGDKLDNARRFLEVI